MKDLLVFQSLWAMERRHTDGFERSLEDNVRMIAEAGYDGVSGDFSNQNSAQRIAEAVRPHGLQIEALCFPKTVDQLKPTIEYATKYGAHHINLQPNAKPRKLSDCIPILEGWQRLAEEVDIPVYFETHRDRMTTDLFFTLDILDQLPDLKLLGDLSHFLVGREFAWPVSDEDHAGIHRILDKCWAFHGRVASREQVQIEISFQHHKMWFDLFLGWWEYGFRSWLARSGQESELVFTCELGPQPYAITGRDGNDTTDRWAEALIMRDAVQRVWNKINA
jgi:hypothetical protein